jgi:hypothetical protein
VVLPLSSLREVWLSTRGGKISLCVAFQLDRYGQVLRAGVARSRSMHESMAAGRKPEFVNCQLAAKTCVRDEWVSFACYLISPYD